MVLSFTLEGKPLHERMDALDEAHPSHSDHDEKDGGEENVDADEREGNNDFSQQDNENEDDGDNRSQAQSQKQDYKDLLMEERMSRLNLQNIRDTDDRVGNMRSPGGVQNQVSSPQFRQDEYNMALRQNSYPQTEGYNESYQVNYDDFDQTPNSAYGQENQDSSQNNMLIMQYESVLQSVNREFQKLLNKNKETEEELSILKVKHEQLQAAYEQESNRNAQNEGKVCY